MAKRIGPSEAQQHLQSNGALLVCAYDSEEKFDQNHLKGAIPLDSFEARKSNLAKDNEIIFY